MPYSSESPSDAAHLRPDPISRILTAMKWGLTIAFISSVAFCARADQPAATEQDIACLARNVYFEARNQSIEGQLAVAHVTLNRLEESAEPRTICDIVYRPGLFSWTRDERKHDGQIWEKTAWETARWVAMIAVAEPAADPVRGSTFYHAVSVEPYWASALVRVGQIGDHVFYARPARGTIRSP